MNSMAVSDVYYLYAVTKSNYIWNGKIIPLYPVFTRPRSGLRTEAGTRPDLQGQYRHYADWVCKLYGSFRVWLCHRKTILPGRRHSSHEFHKQDTRVSEISIYPSYSGTRNLLVCSQRRRIYQSYIRNTRCRAIAQQGSHQGIVKDAGVETRQTQRPACADARCLVSSFQKIDIRFY